MPDYKKALQEGFNAAIKAEGARKEIEAVLLEFRTEILEETEQKILISLVRFEEPLDSFREVMRIGVMTRREPRPTYLAIAAKNQQIEKSAYKELARWKQAKEGYPCSIILGSDEKQFENRQALEWGLAELLRDPQVGEILYVLSQQK